MKIKLMIPVGIGIVVIIAISVLAFLERNNNIDIKNYCSRKNHLTLGQCPNGDYVTGNNMVYDKNGTYLMYFGTFGKRVSVIGWMNKIIYHRDIGCYYADMKVICEGQPGMIID